MTDLAALELALSRSILECLGECWDEPGAFDQWLEEVDDRLKGADRDGV